MGSSATLYTRRVSTDEFRLLEVTGKDSCGILECTLQCHKLDSSPPYKALSYSWGFVDISHTIRCNGLDVLVSRSVHTALTTLYQLGLANKSKSLWIDAVCVNQKDAVEKTEQVRMMQTIYQSAETVLIWLGDESPSEARGLDFMRRLWAVLQKEGDFEHMDSKELKRLALPPQTDRLWDDSLTFLAKSWFTRVWIIQELVCSTNAMLVTKKRTVPPAQVFETFVALWDSNFYRTEIYGPRHPERSTGNAMVLWNMYKLWKKVGRLDLSYCLLHGWTFTATDERDKIFAMTALCGNNLTRLIDYEKTIDEVLVDTAKILFRMQRYPLDALSYSRMMQRDRNASWVPNWTSASMKIRPLLEPSERSENTEQHKASFSFIGKKVLVVNAVTFDRISCSTSKSIPQWDQWLKVGRQITKIEAESQDIWSPSADTIVSAIKGTISITKRLESTWEDFRGCYRQLLHCHNESLEISEQSGGRKGKDAYWYTLNHGKELETPQGNVEHLQQLAAKLSLESQHLNNVQGRVFDINVIIGLFLIVFGVCSTFHIRFFSGSVFTPFKPPIEISLKLSITTLMTGLLWIETQRKKAFLRSMVRCRQEIEKALHVAAGFAWRNRGRKFGLTDRGYGCWAPAWIKPGDEISLFEGSRFPFVTRKVLLESMEDADRHELLGDIYLHSFDQDTIRGKEKSRSMMLL